MQVNIGKSTCIIVRNAPAAGFRESTVDKSVEDIAFFYAAVFGEYFFAYPGFIRVLLCFYPFTEDLKCFFGCTANIELKAFVVFGSPVERYEIDILLVYHNCILLKIHIPRFYRG